MNKLRMNKHLISLMAFDENKGLKVESMLRVGFLQKTNMKEELATYIVKIPDGLAPEKHADTQALLLRLSDVHHWSGQEVCKSVNLYNFPVVHF